MEASWNFDSQDRVVTFVILYNYIRNAPPEIFIGRMTPPIHWIGCDSVRRAWRDALLYVDNMRHVGVLISMVLKVVEEVMATEF
jgi:hypothetical protein